MPKVLIQVEKIEQPRKGAKTSSSADDRLRAFLHRLFADSPLSRAQIAESLERYLGEPVSLARLDSFTANKKKAARLPAYMVQGIAEVLGNDLILHFLARPCTRKRFEFVEHVQQLRKIADDLLSEGEE